MSVIRGETYGVAIGYSVAAPLALNRDGLPHSKPLARLRRWLCKPAAVFCTLLLALGMGAEAQQFRGKTPPRIGFVYPDGLQQGTTYDIVVGGQYLEGTRELMVTGSGIRATLLKYSHPLPQKRLNELRDYLTEARKRYQETKKRPPGLTRLDTVEAISRILREANATQDEIDSFFEMRKERNDPKRQQNVQLSESITLRVQAEANAVPGVRELRVLTPNGASNPLVFCVGKLPEVRKTGPLGKASPMRVTPPTILNGQLLPGEVDNYAFSAKHGARLVVAVQARDLIPYLADAVPGWFQPVVTLYDAKGREVAYANDFRFSPDPVLSFQVPEDGEYRLELKDALYRGREDFVYRVTLGEVPFVTAVFPMGARTGASATATVMGWNLPQSQTVLKAGTTEGIRPVASLSNGLAIGDVPFASDALPEVMEREPNDTPAQAQQIPLPAIVNGRIDRPGDVDVYTFPLGAGAKIVAEVNARKLGSPLDSWLKITDASGRQVAYNDDWEDKAVGLLTHKADSYLLFTAPVAGYYSVRIGDAQNRGGPDYGYRLRISPPRPDFALRVVPSAINAKPGGTTPVTLYAARKDGFSGDISVVLEGAPANFILTNAVIPADRDQARATITFPRDLTGKAISLKMTGRATADGRALSRPAVPSDDLIQAFVYHHLVPARELLAVPTDPGRGAPPVTVITHEPLSIPVGGIAHLVVSSPWRGPANGEVRFALSEPPEGFTLENGKSSPEGITFNVKTDAKVKPGLRGNLIVEIIVENTPSEADAKARKVRRFPVGFLPAIAYKTVSR